ncbi:MAG: homogentisate 1,2-dioxygenase [Steroidobacteraceae bacterium]|jgi:homogentisate 1,2-dioxygenase
MSIEAIHPSPVAALTEPLTYQSGFAQEFATEALAGALPEGRNSPQQCPYGLYAEQLSGTAFTAPRHSNRRSWLYRIRPAAVHLPFEPYAHAGVEALLQLPATPPDQMRWDPYPLPQVPTDFIDGLQAYAGNGSAEQQQGSGIYLYAANRSMDTRFFYDADGELLIVPQQGRMLISTELGRLLIEPQEIALIPRGVRFRVGLPDGSARGYICENYGTPFKLPDLGPIGSNGLANARDFQTPSAWFEDRNVKCELIGKFLGRLWTAALEHSPLDVVAWHGTHAPCKYDLRRFNAIGSISYDHPDPSIFLVLHSVSAVPGVDDIDFVIFPPRWLAMENTFRPPWYHRNIACEFMGLVHGIYDAKADGFLPGGASLHNCMTGHGPDAETFERASAANTTQPHRIADTMAFMFETRAVIRPTHFALQSPLRQADYAKCWSTLRSHFDPKRR